MLHVIELFKPSDGLLKSNLKWYKYYVAATNVIILTSRTNAERQTEQILRE